MYRLVMPVPYVKSAFKTVQSHKKLTNHRIITILYFKNEQTSLHIYVQNEFAIDQVVF
jgi:hypothetical protein